ncbi:SMI1/KNR4 family protein [Streptomyces sp. PvR034]|uniref:SMI1/KNR4 family protein n=1 Tax=Streptomyces sp. PvR034 TaxID=3156401 RepID=UPI00339AE017
MDEGQDMHGTDAVAALAALIPVAGGVDERIRWDEVEETWGKRFPSDYVRFMEVYGAGVVQDAIDVLLPSVRADGWPYREGPGLRDETELVREMWDMCGDEADFEVDPASIVAWAVTSGADIYCWDTTDDDPDRWPVLICGRHTHPEFQLHPVGMAGFLHGLLSDEEFRQQKISVVLGGKASFVNWRDRAEVPRQGRALE